jgi:hypothetical protein
MKSCWVSVARLEAFTAMKIEAAVFWGMTPCSDMVRTLLPPPSSCAVAERSFKTHYYCYYYYCYYC